jgi:hypothetical protein
VQLNVVEFEGGGTPNEFTVTTNDITIPINSPLTIDYIIGYVQAYCPTDGNISHLAVIVSHDINITRTGNYKVIISVTNTSNITIFAIIDVAIVR